MLGSMRKGSVIVDVAIDQGGCFAVSFQEVAHSAVAGNSEVA